MYLYIGGSDSVDIDLDDMQEEQVGEVEILCKRLYADMLDNNLTEDAVTANLRTWKRTMGHYFPAEILAAIPDTHKQLLSQFQSKMESIIRIPACAGDCSLLEDVNPTPRYSCGCTGVDMAAWKQSPRGNLTPVREFLTISLSENIRSWYIYIYIYQCIILITSYA